ncbi:MAG: bifunctional enoyl-CoA hydratase/phosphate acetyltransferase [Hyphomicrobium sp.]|nr:bifunctional enoyl-CoA hydratase/phosphate acetyltransferase [Hyphomicrobium sp.]
MKQEPRKLKDLIERTKDLTPIRVAVVNAAQKVVLETLRDAVDLGLTEPTLVGESSVIRDLAASVGLRINSDKIIDAKSDGTAAAAAVKLVRDGTVDVLMKGKIHTDILMHAILNSDHGLRLPGRRVSHVFLCDIPSYPKLLFITDAAINIAPDVNAKAQILQNAIELCHLLDIEEPLVAALSAVETVNPEIPSTVHAACLTLMGQRGQITGAVIDGPLAFDNAISLRAANEKGIASKVAGKCDILLVPDLVSGNILAKNLEYLAGSVAAGIVLGLSAPVVLSSRADQAPARLAALALAAHIHHATARFTHPRPVSDERGLECAPQPEMACCPLPR